MYNVKPKRNNRAALKKFKVAFLTFMLLYVSFHSFAQINEKKLFDDYCVDCHTIGGGSINGPDLLGVEQKFSNDWLIKFIKSSETMINEGDPKAIQSYKENDENGMPDTDLSIPEIQALIDYIKSFNKAVKKRTTQNTSDNKNFTVEQDNTKTDDYEKRLDAIEKKIDMILEFHKKSFSVRITDEEIQKGRDLFEGEVSLINNGKACVTCHNTSIIDTLNWNPSAFDIAETFSKRNDMDMANLLINPVSEKMKVVLLEHELTNEEVFFITAFLQNLERTGLKQHKKRPIRMYIFIGFCLIAFLSFFDLLFTQFSKYRIINIIVFFIACGFIYNILYKNAIAIGLSQNYAPDQPIKFSHKIHVQENNIECLFCHNSPEYSRESGIPTTNVCMICHNKIKTGELTGSFEIDKIIKSYKNKKSIEWIKIHNIPDFVFFSHAQHVNIGQIECQVCHGNIEEMHVTKQYATLSMGWCVKCHRNSSVQFEENVFYSKHIELQNDLKNGKIDRVTPAKVGANDCQKCHY